MDDERRAHLERMQNEQLRPTSDEERPHDAPARNTEQYRADLRAFLVLIENTVAAHNAGAIYHPPRLVVDNERSTDAGQAKDGKPTRRGA